MTLELDPRRTAVLALDLQNDIVAAITKVEAVLDNVNNLFCTARGQIIRGPAPTPQSGASPASLNP